MTVIRLTAAVAILLTGGLVGNWPGDARADGPDGADAPAPPMVKKGRVQGRVIQVTAREVFVDFGGSHGIKSGELVLIDVAGQAIELPVLDVWDAGARCRLGPDQPIPKVGAPASAAVRELVKPRKKRFRQRRLAKPRPLDDLLARWTGLSLERPSLVAYGESSGMESDDGRDPRVHGMFALEYVGLVDPRPGQLDKQYHQMALRSDLDVPSIMGGRFDYQHRLRLRYDLAPDLDTRPFARSRSLIRIYRMRLGFNLGGFQGAIGRTMAGASGAALPGVGVIDGVNVRRSVAEGVQVGAWAGAAPRISDLRPLGGALGFGAYGSLRRQLDNRKRTRIGVDGGFLGTTFDGQLDRRAVSVRASVTERDRWVHGQMILDIGADTRPTVEPSLAFIDAGARLTRSVRATVRFDHVRSVRTAEAMSELPPEYLSTVAFTAVRAGASVRIARGLHAAARAGWRMTAEGAGSLTSSASVRARGVWLADDRVSVGIDGAVGTYIDGAAARASYTLPLHRHIDVSAGYRFYGYRYGGENQRLYRHQPSLSLDGRLLNRFHGHLDLDAFLGSEEMVIATFASLSMRF